MLFLDSLFNGVSIGAVLLIAALGLAIVFGIMGVINLAHGELMMIGAYTTYVVQNCFKLLGDNWFEFYIIFAIPIAFLVAAAVGLMLERWVIRYLYGRPLETLLATWGVSLILQQFVRSISWSMFVGIVLFSLLFFGGIWVLKKRLDFDRLRRPAIAVLLPLSVGIAIAASVLSGNLFKLAFTKPWFGAQGVDVTAPGWLRQGLELGSLYLPYVRLFIIGLTVVCVAGIYLFLQRSPWGLRIRAVTQNRTMSACLGIPTQKVDALTFAIGSGLAGIAGCAISFLGSVGPNTGQNYIVDAFMVVVVGGVGQLFGTIVAAIAIGTVSYLLGSGTIAALVSDVTFLSDFFSFFANTSMARVMVFALIIAFLQVRPAGLFPQKGRTVDA
ncbi:branched-chain amino acid ABC transporter permease [Oxynema sp. CENA135]|uniref:ABC transporter permease n=1 Tax=Oxynema sp. CENA135 TaxID=984206 RepID=UPI00190CDFF5|nr:branched-chain amino acid ABC transporter permease [Oxynema sp. CENA135]